MVVEFFSFHEQISTSPMLSGFVFLIIIILLLSFNTFTSNDGKVTTLSYSPEWSYWPYKGFYSFLLVKYVTNTHVFKQGILRLLSESGQN